MTAKTTTKYQPALQITKVKAHPQNPRTGNVAVIAESLAENGQYRPIVISSDGFILAGNHTHAAAVELGWEVIDAVRVNHKHDSVAARRIMLADNRTSDLGSYDDRELLDLLKELDTDQGLMGSGYDDTDLASLELALREHAPIVPPGEFPEMDENLKTEHACPSCGYRWSGSKTPGDET